MRHLHHEAVSGMQFPYITPICRKNSQILTKLFCLANF